MDFGGYLVDVKFWLRTGEYMQGKPTCPHCGESLEEGIPNAIQDPVNIQCPICGMNYTYYRNESESTEQESYYFSTGFHRRHPMQRGSREGPEQSMVMTRSCLLSLCIIGSLILFGILLIMEFVFRMFGWFGY